jgi:hypothetical protein
MRSQSIRRLLSGVAFGLFGLLGSAQADILDFESLPADSLFTSGDTFTQSTFWRFTQNGDFGLATTAAAFSVALPPAGNDTQFYSVVNDASLSLGRTDTSAFAITGFDVSFLAPVPLDPGTSAGRLFLFATDTSGNSLFNSWDLGVSADDGTFSFQSFDFGIGPFTSLTSATFVACGYEFDGCLNPFQNAAQFALDNVRVIEVPEPAAYALLALGLFGVAVCGRRVRR